MCLLITSFATWKYQQRSNSSDVLLGTVLNEHPEFIMENCRIMRRLPVDSNRASQRILNAVQRYRPRTLVMCGMGGTIGLQLEKNAGLGNKRQYSDLNLNALGSGLSSTRVSHYAGRFVCNETYYRVLKAVRRRRLKVKCIFLHIPVLDESNTKRISADFYEILSRLAHVHT